MTTKGEMTVTRFEILTRVFSEVTGLPPGHVLMAATAAGLTLPDEVPEAEALVKGLLEHREGILGLFSLGEKLQPDRN